VRLSALAPALVFVLAVVAAASTARAQAGAPAGSSSAPPSPTPWRFVVDLPLVLTAQPPPSNVDTVQVPWLALRAGVLSHAEAGGFVGADAVASVGYERQGTPQVGGARLPLLLEARGRAGGRWRGGLVGVGGYGVAGVGVGAGLALFDAYDRTVVRGFGVGALRAGGGLELSYLRLVTRVELLGGVRDLRPELVGTFGVGLLL
jgi:hypothetical protein